MGTHEPVHVPEGNHLFLEHASPMDGDEVSPATVSTNNKGWGTTDGDTLRK